MNGRLKVKYIGCDYDESLGLKYLDAGYVDGYFYANMNSHRFPAAVFVREDGKFFAVKLDEIELVDSMID